MYVFVPVIGAANVAAKRAMKVMKSVVRMATIFSELLVEQYYTDRAQASVKQPKTGDVWVVNVVKGRRR
jgi:Tfp pilus assembly protein PilV